MTDLELSDELDSEGLAQPSPVEAPPAGFPATWNRNGFRHEALLYAGTEQFLDGALPFIRQGLAGNEPVLAVVSSFKIDRLRAELDGDADRVRFADMTKVGTNPARIIPLWRDFADEHAGSPLWGIGEPIWAERTPAELIECQRHESLLNLAFAEMPAFRLLCPYDTGSLDGVVVEEAHRSHPWTVRDGIEGASGAYRGLQAVAAPFDPALPPPPVNAPGLIFRDGGLRSIRQFVRRHASEAGLGESRTWELLLAANEAATNSLRHAGGHGMVRVWADADSVVCEVCDAGFIDEPLAGRRRPAPDAERGRGLWLANQLCELVQIRSSPGGSVVRLHVKRR